MNKLPTTARQSVELRIEKQHVRDKMIMGYHEASGVAWCAFIDAKGRIEHEIAEPMPRACYGVFVEGIGDLVRRRGGAMNITIAGPTGGQSH